MLTCLCCGAGDAAGLAGKQGGHLTATKQQTELLMLSCRFGPAGICLGLHCDRNHASSTTTALTRPCVMLHLFAVAWYVASALTSDMALMLTDRQLTRGCLQGRTDRQTDR